MKIAVPYKNGQVFQNFGHSAQLQQTPHSETKSTSGNSCCSICNERVISANAQCSGLIQNPPCKSCTDLAVLRPIGAFPPAQQCIL